MWNQKMNMYLIESCFCLEFQNSISSADSFCQQGFTCMWLSCVTSTSGDL